MKRKSQNDPEWEVPPASKFNDGFEVAKHIVNKETGKNLIEILNEYGMYGLSPSQDIDRLIEAREAEKALKNADSLRRNQPGNDWDLDYYKHEIKIFEAAIKDTKPEDAEFTSYRQYISYCNDQITRLSNPGKDWKELHKNLIIGKYIGDVSLNDFNEVMNYHRLPNGKERINWLTKKAEAVYFQKAKGFTMKDFNTCFVFKDRSSFQENNRLKTNPPQVFRNIIDQ